MISKENVQPGDVLQDIYDGHFYVITRLHPFKEQVKVLRKDPPANVASRHRQKPYVPQKYRGYYRSCARFEEAVSPELKEMEQEASL